MFLKSIIRCTLSISLVLFLSSCGKANEQAVSEKSSCAPDPENRISTCDNILHLIYVVRSIPGGGDDQVRKLLNGAREQRCNTSNWCVAR